MKGYILGLPDVWEQYAWIHSGNEKPHDAEHVLSVVTLRRARPVQLDVCDHTMS